MFINALVDLAVFDELMTCHVWPNLAMSEPSSQTSSPTILFLSPPPLSPPAPTSTIAVTVTDVDSDSDGTIHCTPHHLSLLLHHHKPLPPHCLHHPPSPPPVHHATSPLPVPSEPYHCYCYITSFDTIGHCHHCHYITMSPSHPTLPVLLTGKHMTASLSHHWPEPP